METFLDILSLCVAISAILGIESIRYNSASCHIPPSLPKATWLSTRWDDLTFTATYITVPDMNDLGKDVVFFCELNSTTKFLIRSVNVVNILGIDYDIVACLDFPQGISAVKMIYYHATSEWFLPSGATQPVQLVSPGAMKTIEDTCTMTTYRLGAHDL
ncbi:hypothetical protein EGW08_012559, partial [Elysia chlorotica]